MHIKEFKFDELEKVRDIASGFVGTVTATMHHDGVVEYLILPPVLTFGNTIPKGGWIPEQRLEQIATFDSIMPSAKPTIQPHAGPE